MRARQDYAKLILVLCIPWLMCESYILTYVSYADIPSLTAISQILRLFILLAVPLSWILTKGINKKWGIAISGYSLLLMVYLVVGLKNGNGIGNILLSIKNIYFWVFYFLLIVASKINFSDGIIKITISALIFFALINIAYSVYINITFSGNYSDFYFYELYKGKGMFEDWNFIRDGDVRAFGLMGSKLTLSQTLIIPFFLTISGLLHGKGVVRRTLYGIMMLVIGYGIYLTSTRNPISAILLAIAFMGVIRVVGKGWKTMIASFLGIYAIGITAIYLYSEAGGGDFSSQARIPLLLQFIDVFQQNKWGYGVGSAGIVNLTYKFFFESSAATVFTDLGLAGGIIYFGTIIASAFYIFRNLERANRHQVNFAWAIGAATIALLFLTNFSNIYDSSLYIYSIALAIAVRYTEAKKLHGAPRLALAA